MDVTTWILIAVVVVLLIVVVALLVPRLRERKRSKQLKKRFGPEYDHAVARAGERHDGEEELRRREERRAHLDIRPLDPALRQQYTEEWRATQKRFVDAPDSATTEADDLVRRVMRDRGYPVDDFEQRADDVSVDHPTVVENYRAANRVAEANRRGEASTEDLRQALVNYRSLFDRLLDDGQGADTDQRSATREVR